MVQTEEFTFQTVAYRTTVYKTGVACSTYEQKDWYPQRRNSALIVNVKKIG
jgi:predicted small secreted protein